MAPTLRKIIHVDMDAFFAAIEQRDDAGLRGRPIAVGGAGGRGVVMTASYEARVFGVRSAMPSVTAKRLCPDLVFVPARMEVYRAVSREVRQIFAAYADRVEPLSLDEAYLDVTERAAVGGAVRIARAIKTAILEATGLTASAGVSVNKFLAKLASGLDKPDGLTVLRPERAAALLASLPVEALHGIGPATAARLRAQGIATGADLQARSRADLVARFGRAGLHFWEIARGHDDRPVEPDRPRRSVSVETTFETDLAGPAALLEELAPLARELARRLARSGFQGRTVTLKIKDARFRVRTRSLTLGRPPADARELLALARRLLLEPGPPDEPVRLLGLGVAAAGEGEDPRQLRLDLPDQG